MTRTTSQILSNLTGFTPHAGPLAGSHRVLLDANGNADNIKGDNNDGQLLMNLGSNLVPYFLQNLLGTQVLKGNCLAGVDEANRPCIQ